MSDSYSFSFQGGYYTGEAINGLPDGFGKIIWADDSSYEGNWVSGKRYGEGTYTSNTGFIQNGFFYNDFYIGKVTKIDEYGRETKISDLDHVFDSNVVIRYINGDFYSGQWFAGKKNGYGRFEQVNSPPKIGFFFNDRFIGLLKGLDKTGKEYDIDFKNAQYCGFVRIQYLNGAIYQGDWKNGYRDGYGICTYPNGDHYKGSWVKDVRDGEGTYIFKKTGDIYEGLFKNDLFDTSDSEHNAAKYTYGVDGSYYKGGFKSGFRHGKGIEHVSGCFALDGHWFEGVKTNIFSYEFTDNSTLTGSYVVSDVHDGKYCENDDSFEFDYISGKFILKTNKITSKTAKIVYNFASKLNKKLIPNITKSEIDDLFDLAFKNGYTKDFTNEDDFIDFEYDKYDSYEINVPYYETVHDRSHTMGYTDVPDWMLDGGWER